MGLAFANSVVPERPAVKKKTNQQLTIADIGNDLDEKLLVFELDPNGDRHFANARLANTITVGASKLKRTSTITLLLFWVIKRPPSLPIRAKALFQSSIWSILNVSHFASNLTKSSVW